MQHQPVQKHDDKNIPHTGGHEVPVHVDCHPVTVNGKKFHIHEPMTDARKILDAADYRPAEDCILIRQLHHGTRSIGLDEAVDLRAPGNEIFWAFRGDAIYRFTVREHGFDWADATIKEPMLRAIAHVKEDEIIIVIEPHEHEGRELGPDDELHLADPHMKHLRVEKRLIRVFFKDEPYEIPRGVYTTEQLMALFPIEKGYLLNVVRDGQLVTLQPGEKIRVECDMHFYSQNPGGGSS